MGVEALVDNPLLNFADNIVIQERDWSVVCDLFTRGFLVQRTGSGIAPIIRLAAARLARRTR